MGRDWYWGSAAKSSRKADPEKSDHQPPPSPGCISAVLHLFDFNHFHLPNFHHQPTCTDTTTNHVSFLPLQRTRVKGAEAPRNSLESPEESSASLPSTSKEDENLKIPAMGVRVKTIRTRPKSVEALSNSNVDSCSESEINSSPGAKTPNLVARLMGLDLLPDSNSITPSASSRAKPRFHPRKPTRRQSYMISRHRNSLDGSDIAGTWSPLETPRISSARRSDVDYHHRLSLQLNKDSYMSNENENRSPGLYVKQRVKHVKESSGRKVGTDMTNTVRSRGQQHGKDEPIGGQFKSQKISKRSPLEEPAVPSVSPRPRVLEPSNRTATASPAQKDQNTSQSINPQNLQSFKFSSRLAKKFKNYSNINNTAKFDVRLRKPQQATDIIRNKQEETFVRSPAGNRVDAYNKRCKKTPLFPHLLNISVPNLPHVKDPYPPETKITQKKQSSEAHKSNPNRGSSPLSRSSSQGYKEEEATHAHGTQDGDCRYGGGSTGATTGDESAERRYVAIVLRRAGIHSNTIVSSASWFSHSRPLNPSIFYWLEYLGPVTGTTASGQMGHRCNRKLVFDLVDVILAECLKPYFNKKPCASPVQTEIHLMNGTQLVEALVSKLRSFPLADCRVLEDIDALVEMDLQREKLRDTMALVEEGEGIATAVEEEILERLIEETATEVCRASGWCRFEAGDGGVSEAVTWSLT